MTVATTSATSLGFNRRPSGTFSPSHILVAVAPGDISVTPISSLLSSWRKLIARPRSAHFETPQVGAEGYGSYPPVDPIMTIPRVGGLRRNGGKFFIKKKIKKKMTF